MIALLKIFLAPVVSIILISIVSHLVWTLAQALGVGNAVVGFVISLATMLAAIQALIGWTVSLPNGIAEALKIEEIQK